MSKKTLSLYRRALRGDLEALYIQFELGHSPLDGSEESKCFLHLAAQYGRVDLVHTLIAEKSPIDHKERGMGWTAVHYAVCHNRVKTLEALLDRGAKVDVEDNDGVTPIQIAVLNKHEGTTLLLLERKANVKGVNRMDESLLYTAISQGASETLIYYLLRFNVNVDACNNSGWTPLHLAVYNNRVVVVDMLRKMRASANIPDASKDTPLHLAVEKDDFYIVELLLLMGASALMRGSRGKTALEIAQEKKNHRIVGAIQKSITMGLSDQDVMIYE